MEYDWPGNVRELENTIERAVALHDGDVIGAEGLPPHVRSRPASAAVVSAPTFDEPVHDLDKAVETFERRIILSALERANWRQNRAAADLGVTERSMWYKIKKLGIEIKKGEGE
jgi:DNA-binding NtrC family response regulator